MGTPPSEQLEDRSFVFVSYSHADVVWAQRFEVLLKPLVRARRLQLWVDSAIRTGDAWRSEIERAISLSRLGLLLVSADYLASDFVMGHELPALVNHGVRLAPILVGDCLWQQIPALSHVQWLHDPGRDGALALDVHEPGARDRRMRLACEQILRVLSMPGPPTEPSALRRAEPATPSSQALTASASLSQVPALPPGYVPRADLEPLIVELIHGATEHDSGPPGSSVAVGIHGAGGMGKTVLAAAVAYDKRVRATFPDGVYWLTVGEQPDLLALQLDLIERLGGRDRPSARTVLKAREYLQELLVDRRILIVVDDVWSDSAAHAFRVAGKQSQTLYISRDEQVLSAVDASSYHIDALSADQARAIAAAILQIKPDRLPRAADDAIARVGRVPLAIALVSAAVRGGRSWSDVADTLDLDADVYGEHPYAGAFRAMHLAISALPDPLRSAAFELAVFPPDAEIPIAVVARYWAHTRGLGAAAAISDLDSLAVAGLVRRSGDVVQLHDLQHDYLLLHAPAPALLHGELLTAYQALLPADHTDEWWRLPRQESYMRDNVVRHLGHAGDRRTLGRLLTEPSYHIERIAGRGSYASEADLALAARFIPNDHLVRGWRRWLARHAHLLRGRSGQDFEQRRHGIAATMLAWRQAGSLQLTSSQLQHVTEQLSERYLSVVSGLNLAADELLRVLAGHSAGVSAAAWSPDGSYLASADYDGEIRIWDPVSATTVATATRHTDSVFAIAWSPTGMRLAIAGADRALLIWDSAIDRTTTLSGHGYSVRGVAWSPDGRQLASAGNDRTVLIWDTASWQIVNRLTGHTHAVFALAWSPDGDSLASAGINGDICIWDPVIGNIKTVLKGDISGVNAVDWSPDGTRLATAGKHPHRLEPGQRRHQHTRRAHWLVTRYGLVP